MTLALPRDWRVYAVVIGAAVLGVAYVEKKAGDALQAVNPLNDSNVIAGSVNDAGAKIAGAPSGSWSLGSALFEMFHPGAVAKENRAIYGGGLLQ